MNVREFAEKMELKVLTGEAGLDQEVTGIYICDLLSWVMSHASHGDAWITVLTHLNVAAVALLTEAACVIIPEGITVEEATLSKAMKEKIPFLSSESTGYEICCRAHRLFGGSDAVRR